MELVLASRSIEDLEQTAAGGCGYRVRLADRSLEDLIRIAAAARQGLCLVVIVGMDGQSSKDISRINAAGLGFVVFSRESS